MNQGDNTVVAAMLGELETQRFRQLVGDSRWASGDIPTEAPIETTLAGYIGRPVVMDW